MTTKLLTPAEKLRSVLDGATDFLPVNALCMAVYGSAGARERAAMAVLLHRLGDEVEKRAAGYRRRR